ncbi:MAG: HesA/MoeB/ThiF family protein [bacterium]
MKLTDKIKKRYNRQIIIPDIGEEGQQKLISGSVLIIGAGGLGSASALYLASAGIGRIGIADSDKVEISNLHRQILYTSKDLGREKTCSAKKKLKAHNPDIKVDTYPERVTTENIFSLIEPYDFVVDAADSFASKFLINDACVIKQKPYSHAGVIRFEGQLFTYIPGSACLRCIFPESPQTIMPGCQDQGIVGAVAGLFGTFQAVETIKAILNKGMPLVNRLLTINAFTLQMRILPFNKRTECSICGNKEAQLDPKKYEEWSCA